MTSNPVATNGSAHVLALVRALFPGRYDNGHQRKAELARGADLPHGFLAAKVDAVSAPAFGPCTFVVLGYPGWDRPPYMVRLYAFHAEPLGVASPVRLAVHYFDDDPRLMENPGAAAPAQGAHYPGCDLAVSARRGVLVCATDPLTAIKTVDGVEGAAEHYSFSFDAHAMNVRRATFAPSGAQLSGRPDGAPYKLRRLPQP